MEPLQQYVMNLEVIVTPFDPKGNQVAKFVYTYYSGGNPNLKQPDAQVSSKSNLQFNLIYDDEIKNSLLKITMSSFNKKTAGSPSGF